MQLVNYIAVLRPKQWLKNVLIFFPAFFSLSILDKDIFLTLLIISVGFCCIASSIYIFNDLCDIKEDLLHPVKKLKPIASGKINKKNSYLFSFVLFVLGSILIGLIYPQGIYFCLIYAVINILYSTSVKHIPLLDIMFVSVGFLIRIYLGGYAINVPISLWLSSLIILMSVYILIAKRKDDVLNYKLYQKETRQNIHFYAKVNYSITLYSLAILIISIYSLYTFSSGTISLFKSDKLWVTIPFAGIGIFSFTKNVTKTTSLFEPIGLILSNKIIVGSLLLWITIFGWLIYG